MPSDVAISVEGVGKCYRVGHQAHREEHPTLRDQIVRHARSFARKTRDMASGQAIVQGDTVEDFWALRDVSFDIPRGARLGILGRNGAGKSTLLKVLSRITEPTTGRIKINGRVASLLEVGTGFHPELTGRENIFLNGAILGMSRREIQSKFDEIVEFAEVERFLDTPVKRYSSGMYVRLAFAVAAHLEPEILIVDEVLAVGDAQFQQKCLGKMKDVGKEGRTIIFVSHNVAAINQLCDSGIYLKDGTLIAHSSTKDAVARYMDQGVTDAAFSDWPEGLGAGVVLHRIEACDQKLARRFEFSAPEPILVRLEINVESPMPEVHLGFKLFSSDGTVVFTSQDSDSLPATAASVAGRQVLIATIPGGFLNEGTYHLSIAAHVPEVRILFSQENVVRFKVNGVDAMWAEGGSNRLGVIRPRLDWQLSHVLS